MKWPRKGNHMKIQNTPGMSPASRIRITPVHYLCGARTGAGAMVLAQLALAGLSAGFAQAQTIAMATDRVGSTFNAIGAGISKIITEGGKNRVIVKAFAGPDAYLGALQSGEVKLATMSSSTAYVAYLGQNKAKRRYDNMRVLRAGEGGVRLTFLVRADSPIKTVQDLKGRKVSAGFGGHSVIPSSIAGALATVGLSWKDVVSVPVTGSVDGVQALGTGRVEASWTSFGMPVSREMHSKIGVRYLPIPPGEASLAVLRKHIFPGVQLVKTAANPSIGLPEEAYLISYDSYLVGAADLDEKSATAILAALWDQEAALTKVHPGLRGFTNARAVTDIPVIPYHPAAVAFYKSKGVWNAKAEAANAAIK